MWLRVAVVTLLLGVTAALYLARPEDALRAFPLFLFALIAGTYLLTVLYALRLRQIDRMWRAGLGARVTHRELASLGGLQLAGDLVVATLLVHATGGVESAFTVFYLLSILGAGVIAHRRGALIAASASIVLFGAVALLGWTGLLPPVPGQLVLPTKATLQTMAWSLMVNSVVSAAVALLAGQLGEQLRKTSEVLEAERSRYGDLATQGDDILRSLQSGLLTLDLEDRILAMNEMAEQILGINPLRTDFGRRLGHVVPELSTLMDHARAYGRLPRGEAALPGGDGGAPRVVGLSIAPLRNRHGAQIGHIVNLTDLTEVKQLEGKVKRAERLATVGSLAAAIAHEVRNPLASLSGSIELLKRIEGLGEEDRNLMEIALREVDRLNDLVSGLLEYSRPRGTTYTDVDLAGLSREAVKMLENDPRHRDVTLELQLNVDPSLSCVIDGDPAQLRQVLWNLMLNGAESMVDGGRLRLTIQGGDPESGRAVAVVTIEDEGGGIPPELREQIFEPFFSTKPTGSGLGLAIARRIIDDHGGSVAISSREPRGTCMRITLPLRRSTSPASSERGPVN
jgi:two-component system sensor histidine kinase PilS (NtrC family)